MVEIMMRYLIVFALMAYSLVACSESPSSTDTTQPVAIAPVVDIPSIVGLQVEEIKSQLGEPSSCEDSKYGRKCFFIPGDTEIIFINGAADWITVNDMASAPYSETSLTYLGFDKRSPSFKNANVIRWENIPGIREVSIFPQGNRIFYAYIKGKTP